MQMTLFNQDPVVCEAEIAAGAAAASTFMDFFREHGYIHLIFTEMVFRADADTGERPSWEGSDERNALLDGIEEYAEGKSVAFLTGVIAELKRHL